MRKGRFKGYKIRIVTLEERATCPSTCLHWYDCYGNNMPWARRVDHHHPDFLLRMRQSVAEAVAEAKHGVLLRLHVLGDFFSVAYADFWREMLNEHPTLAIWGYTARDPESDPIGQAVMRMYQEFKATGRFEMRWSDRLDTMGTRSIEHVDDCPPGAFVCPEQTGKTKSCGTCGACWSTTKNVAFVSH